MLNFENLCISELRRLAYSVRSRSTFKFDKNNVKSRATWKFKVRSRLSRFLNEGRIPMDIAWRLKRFVPEKCLRRIGIWELVVDATKSTLPDVTVKRNARTVPTCGIVVLPTIQVPVLQPDPPGNSFVCFEEQEEVVEWLAQETPVESLPAKAVQKLFDLSSRVEHVRKEMETYLADWAVSHNISRSACTALLAVCNVVLPSIRLPKAAATLLSVSPLIFLPTDSSYLSSMA